jgi:hypothetical protein
MTNDIVVSIYSYKGKNLKEVVDNLLKNSSGKRKIKVIVSDQHPLNRRELFSNNKDCMYFHIFWDFVSSPCKHKNNFIKNNLSKYSLILGDTVLLPENWDESLISFVEDKNIIVSGSGGVILSLENIFFLKKEKSYTDNFSITNYINRDFIFGLTSDLSEIKYPTYLKYHGEEEALSIKAFTKGIDIYSAPFGFYSKASEDNIDKIYVPFSLTHNYNEIISLLKNGENSFENINGMSRSVEEFNSFHNEIFKSLNNLPFHTNDVEYDPQALSFNKVDARRYLGNTKAIH